MNNKTKTVAVALSGGVDSATSAYLLKEQGYNVFGITMKLHENQDTSDAEHVAKVLNIKHYIVDYSDLFEKEVIDEFIDLYLNGTTPNPCIICNRKIKYGLLLEDSLKLGADYMAMGHYARIEYDNDEKKYKLLKSAVERKDQSYFLYQLSQDKLKHIIFPLNSFKDKQDVRNKIMHIIPHISQKKDSTNICFTDGVPLSKYIINRKNLTNFRGNFIDKKGNIIGIHNGIFNYTIGQKRGLNLNTEIVYFVLKINAKTNEITLTEDENDLYNSGVIVNKMHYLHDEYKTLNSFKLKVKICQWGYFIDCTVHNHDNGSASIKFDKPERAPAIGQSAVLYNGDEVIGGGTIFNIL